MKHYRSSQRLTPRLAVINNSFSRLVLSLSFCIALFGCDSESAYTAVADDQVTVSADNDKALAIASETSMAAAQGNDAEGTSLMNAAMNEDNFDKRTSPMIAEKRADSALQATLIGDYSGMLSCENCEGISLTLNLRSDGTVQKTSVYTSSRDAQPPLVDSGVYRQDGNMITIVYDEENIETYIIQDNHLVLLGADKQPDNDYTLSRK